jgi:hypothetical protein
MAERGARATGEDRREVAGLMRERRVPDGVDPAMEAVKAPGLNAPPDGPIVQTQGSKLGQGNYPVLPCGQRVQFLSVYGRNGTHPPSVPARA